MHRVLESILKDWPIDRWSNSTIVLAVSGGPDSVAMLRAIHTIIQQSHPTPKTRLVVAHLNHRLRGDQSDLDEDFVKRLAYELKLDAIADTLPQSTESTGEAQWRKARIRFLKDVAKQYRPNPKNGFCEDCTKEYQKKMIAEGRCENPHVWFCKDEDGFEHGTSKIKEEQ